ncbi:MAG TPA: N-acetylmuramoyl-L-alanine amidase [Lachnospiraceae bacterium]|nr:N-acetylmuramoyl-L-alanine amidase [Lachnospiraceae bacterium]
MANKGRTKNKSKSKNKTYGKKQRQRILKIVFQIVVLFFAIIGVIATISVSISAIGNLTGRNDGEGPEVTQDLLTVNSYSRPGIALNKVNGIVVHYTANPGSSAKDNRDYFQNLMLTHKTKASSHYIIGLDGEIIQCIPLEEISYASNSRNTDTIAIECCHPDETGEFTTKTYDSLVKLVAWLCNKYGLSSDSVIRHYDVTGKACPKYFVDNEDAWKEFLKDVDKKK